MSLRQFTFRVWPLAVLLILSGCASFAPSAYVNSSALTDIDTSRGFCVFEPSLDAKRINASKIIQQAFSDAGFDTSCSAKNYAVEWWFESNDQRVDYAFMPTFCSGYGYWRTCSRGHDATLITYQRTFQLVVREAPTQTVVDAAGQPASVLTAAVPTEMDQQPVSEQSEQTFIDPREGAVWVARLDSRGSGTDYMRLIPDLMRPVIMNLGQNRENERMRLVALKESDSASE